MKYNFNIQRSVSKLLRRLGVKDLANHIRENEIVNGFSALFGFENSNSGLVDVSLGILWWYIRLLKKAAVSRVDGG